MLDIRQIRENPELVKDSISRRGLEIDIDRLLDLDSQRRELIVRVEDIQKKRNTLAGEVQAKPSVEQIKAGKDLKSQYEALSSSLQGITTEFYNILQTVPNFIAENTPDGGEESNREERAWGNTELSIEPKDHLALGELHDLFNFEAGAKVAGNKFYFLKDRGVRLWQAIELYAQSVVREAGFELMMVPQMVTTEIAEGTGYMPRGEEGQNYVDKEQNLVMIATSEIPLTGLHKDEVIDVEKPKRYAGLSTCYRLEAGTYGKFSKGLYRTHQFEKLEMYVFCEPQDSNALLQEILKIEEKICQGLEIPYRITRTASGDMSAPAYEKYDVEYWDPVEKQYRELTSCSNCTDYQARNLNIRYRDTEGKLGFVHTLNGTAVVSSRAPIAILENHQQADGTIKLPKALHNYYGGGLL